MKKYQSVYRNILVSALAIFTGIAHEASAALPTFTSSVELRMPDGTPVRDPEDANWGHIDSVSAGYGAAGTLNGPNSGPARWAADGSATLLPGYAGDGIYATGINDAGQVVGTFQAGAIRWEADGTPTILDGSGAAINILNAAYSINNLGVAVGESLLPSEEHRAVRWSADGSMTILGDVPGQTTFGSVAYNISDAGFMAGYAELVIPDEGGGQQHVRYAVRWSPDGSATLLGDAPQTGPSYAPGINNTGEAAGYEFFGSVGSFLAVRWAADGSRTRLGDLPGHFTALSQAWGITDDGLVVGYAYLADMGVNRAVIWDSDGTPSMLQDLMADGNTWIFTDIVGIDANASRLRVLAIGYKNGGPQNVYFVNAVVPEPASLVLCISSFWATSILAFRKPWRDRSFSAALEG